MPPKEVLPLEEWFTTTYLNGLSSDKNDSDLMSRVESAILNKEKPDQFAAGMNALMRALMRDGFSDLYLASMLMASRPGPATKVLLPFVMKAADRTSDPGDLEALCGALAAVRDKRGVPKLIELVDHASKDVSSSAKSALSDITMIPRPRPRNGGTPTTPRPTATSG